MDKEEVEEELLQTEEDEEEYQEDDVDVENIDNNANMERVEEFEEEKQNGEETKTAIQKFDKEIADEVLERAIAAMQEEIINVQNSGFWLVVFSLFYTLIEILGFPFITVVALALLMQVASIAVLVQAKPVLVDAGILDRDFDPRWLAEQRQSFSNNEIDSITKGFSALGLKWMRYWNEVVLDDNAENDDLFLFHLGAFSIFTLLTYLIRLPVILLIGGLLIGFLPFLANQYESNQAMVDAAYNVIIDSLNDFGAVIQEPTAQEG